MGHLVVITEKVSSEPILLRINGEHLEAMENTDYKLRVRIKWTNGKVSFCPKPNEEWRRVLQSLHSQ